MIHRRSLRWCVTRSASPLGGGASRCAIVGFGGFDSAKAAQAKLAFIVWSGVEHTLRDRISRPRVRARVESSIEHEPFPPGRAEHRRRRGSNRTSCTDAGWPPEHTLDANLTDIINDWKARLT